MTALAFLLGLVLGAFAPRANRLRIAKWWRERKLLPCPHPTCEAKMPQSGLWNLYRSETSPEQCSVCGGWVKYQPETSKYYAGWFRVEAPK